ncbi:uncharacterized protein RAG0_14102 [Rhynchosporium agropyri]|uniref:Uncharacterized protein n=1 Tax=Rhynchosporium agropyri TaxID=914238 RepID=A0A1E1LFP8_9HELO|nr:uncharacterized protein RAG0_14102 [Rhynchosporium agropyri]
MEEKRLFLLFLKRYKYLVKGFEGVLKPQLDTVSKQGQGRWPTTLLLSSILPSNQRRRRRVDTLSIAWSRP